MGFSTGKGNKSISEINVTPFVDVMLVLLVIFMITAPLMLNAIKLDLPKTKEVNPINLNSRQVILSFTHSGDYFLGETKLLKKELLEQIKSKFDKLKINILFLRADYKIEYGRVAKLMSFLKSGGILKIALVTEISDKENK